MIERILLNLTKPSDVIESLKGRHADERYYDRPIGGRDVDVIKPDGTLLLAFRTKRVPSAAVRRAWDALDRAARHTNYRRTAAAGAKEFRSGSIGFMKDRKGKVGPTAFTRDDREGWRDVRPLLLSLDSEFRRWCPERHTRQIDQLAHVPPDLVIRGTAFTTAAVNLNARMGVHEDAGNLPGALGVMTVIEAGEYEGGLLVFPRFRVAVDCRSRDVLICDNREYHGNTEMVGIGGRPFERVSVVAYLHSSLVRTGDPA